MCGVVVIVPPFDNILQYFPTILSVHCCVLVETIVCDRSRRSEIEIFCNVVHLYTM